MDPYVSDDECSRSTCDDSSDCDSTEMETALTDHEQGVETSNDTPTKSTSAVVSTPIKGGRVVDFVEKVDACDSTFRVAKVSIVQVSIAIAAFVEFPSIISRLQVEKKIIEKLKNIYKLLF